MPMWIVVVRGGGAHGKDSKVLVESEEENPFIVARTYVQEIGEDATVLVYRVPDEFTGVSVRKEVTWVAALTNPATKPTAQGSKFGNPFRHNECYDQEFLGTVAHGDLFYDVWVARIEPGAAFGAYLCAGSDRIGLEGLGSVKDFMRATSHPPDVLAACMKARPLVESWVEKNGGG